MIVVLGATGAIGGALARRLAERGVPFRAVVRRAGVDVPGAEVVRADLDDPASLPAVLAGAEQLFLNAGGAVPAEGEQPMVAQQEAAVDAAAAAGVRHVVKISVQGATPGRPLAVGAHARIEAHLAASGLEATVLRPSGFFQNLLTGVSAFTGDGDLLDPYDGGAVGYLDAHDIGAVAAAVLTGAASRGGVHTLTGPRLLTHDDLAAALTPALGRSVGVVPLPPSDVVAFLVGRGLSATFAEDVAELSRGAAAGELAELTDAVERLTGRPPRDVTEFVAEHAAELRRVVPQPV